jgi:hypothetical protein
MPMEGPVFCCRNEEMDGEVRRPWCPETRLLEHREQERLNLEAEETRRAAQGQLLNGPVSKLEFRHDFPPLPQVPPRIPTLRVLLLPV